MYDVSKEHKKWVDRFYSERNAAPDGRLNYWRYAIFKDEQDKSNSKGKLINTYYDRGFIDYIFTQQIARALPPEQKCVIADFGCGDGLVAKTVVEQLGRPNDSVLPVGIDNYDIDFWRGEKPTPKIQTVVEGNLLDLHVYFDQDYFHAGIFRFALPFIRKDDQQEALNQIYKVLKPGAVLVVLNDGAFNKTERKKSWNTLFAKCATYGRLANKYYPSCESLKGMAEIAGFHVKDEYAKDLTDIAFGYLSPQICARVFKPNKDQRKRLKTLFEAWKQKDVLQFEPDFLRPNSLRLPWPMYTCVFEK
jgi:ubiquinone/menaquinone biosynthesis C-methylase UbiE